MMKNMTSPAPLPLALPQVMLSGDGENAAWKFENGAAKTGLQDIHGWEEKEEQEGEKGRRDLYSPAYHLRTGDT